MKCKFVQIAKLCKMLNYAKCKSMQNAKIYKVQNYVKCKIMQSAKLFKMQKYARCKFMHVKINPMFCNDLSAEGAKLYLYPGRICMTLRTA